MKGRIFAIFVGCLAALATVNAAIVIVANFPGSGLNQAGDYPFFPHENWLELNSISWGLSSSASATTSGGTTSPNASLNGIHFSKKTDHASPPILRHLARGDVLPKMEVAFLGMGAGGTRYPIMNMALEDVLFAGMGVGASGGDDQLFESLSVATATISLEVFQIGNTQASEVVYWNFVTQSTAPLNPPNTTPFISNPGNVTMPEDGTVTLNFTVSDAETPAGSLTVTRGTDNPLLLPPDGIILGGSGSNRTVTLIPTANQSGVAHVTLQVSDGSLTAQVTFRVTVTAVNDAPVIGPIGPVVIDQDTVVAVPFTVTDIDTDLLDVQVLVTSNNPTLLPPGALTISGSGANRTLSITPAGGQYGTAVVTLRAFDGTDYSEEVSFTLNVNEAVGPHPNPILLSENSVAENSPGGTVIGLLSAAQPTDGVTYSFLLQDDAGGRFMLSGPGNATLQVGTHGELDHETSAEHVITVRMTGSSGSEISQSFVIEVINVNERPIVILPDIETVTPFAPERILTGIFLDDPDGDEPETTVTFAVSHGLLHFHANEFAPGAITGNGTGTLSVTASLANIRTALSTGSLSYRGQFTSLNATLTVTISDNGSGGLGAPLSASASTEFPLALEAHEWLSTYFSEAQRNDPAIVGTNADFDKDGYPTLVEYAFAMDPTQSDPQPLMEVDEIEIEGLRYPTFTYRRLSSAADPILLVTHEIATDNFSWRSGPEYIVWLSSHLVDGTNLEEVTVRSAIPLTGESGSRQMVRLRIAFANQRVGF